MTITPGSSKNGDAQNVPAELGESQSSADSTQLIAFEIDEEAYGLAITDVREIRAWTGATPLPNTPHYVRGVINLRGAIVPIIDLRARFGRGATAATDTHVVIVVAIEGRWVGLLVDAVSDIVSIDRSDIQPPPAVASGGEDGVITGLATKSQKMLALLDTSKLLDRAGDDARLSAA